MSGATSLRRSPEAGPGTDATIPGPVLLLTPSHGLGGGIERYVQTVQAAFAERGVFQQRLDLAHPGPSGHRTLFRSAAAVLADRSDSVRLIVAHPSLLPVATLLSRVRRVNGISVICHGSDVWGTRTGRHWQIESRLMRHRDVRVVAVSSFTAGALFPGAQATILPPGLSREWYATLIAAANTALVPRAGVQLMTAFRLDDWRDKGLPQLTAAVAALGRADVRLVVCGSGHPPADMLAHTARYPWCTVRAGLEDYELAAQLATSDLFVLATRTRSGRRPCGEGFGLVLIEAQVAGTPVIGPAHGGSPDAYLDGVTGVTPGDESVPALARVLERLLAEPAQLAGMGAHGAAWARQCFDPDRYAELAVDRLL